MYKALKRERRTRKREAELAADRAVTEPTATGLPHADRRRDPGHRAGLHGAGRVRRRAAQPARLLHLQERLHAGRRVLPLALPVLRRAPRTPSATSAPTSPAAARCSPAAAPRSACTSPCGCCATAPTPRSPPASRTTPYAGSPPCRTAPSGSHRLKIVGIDLRDPTQVIGLADEVAAAGPLDILINNAAQTVRRSPGAYRRLVELESAPLPTGLALPGDGHLRPDQRRPPGRDRRDPAPARRRPPRRESLEDALAGRAAPT